MTKTANIGQRIIAAFIDWLIAIIFWEVLILLVASSPTISDVLNSLLWVLILGLLLSSILWALFNSFLISTFGGTIGKLLTGAKIVRPGGTPLSFWRAFFRNQIGYLVSGLMFGSGFIWIAIDKDRRGWHDQITDDLVVASRNLGLLTGIISTVILLILNVFLVVQITQAFNHNGNLYTELANEISTELKSVPSLENGKQPLLNNKQFNLGK